MPQTRVVDRLDVVRVWRQAYNAKVWDRWLAAGFTGLAFVPPLSSMSAVFGDLPARPADGFAVLLALAQTVPLAVRSRWPAVCLAIVGLSFAVFETLSYPPQFGTVTLYFALYSVGAHQDRHRRGIAVVASVAYVVLSAVVYALGSPDGFVDFLIFYLMLAACWALGVFVRRRRAEDAELRRLVAAAATTAERARIARELHDVVTHHVTAIVVQADATQFAVESPDRVVTALATIGGTGRRALAELRHLLDVLEATGESMTSRTSVDSTVRDLVERIRMSGQPVEFVEDGDQSALPVEVRLAVYRVVQEGLTNAVKYATGQPTMVRVGSRDGQVEVEVTNAAAVLLAVGARRDLSGGRGLAGLRDRIGPLGGELTTRELPDGGFQLRVLIPIAGDT